MLLEDGTRFDGEGAGAITTALGEAVFTTGMTGYQETLTDPSFNGQIITFFVMTVAAAEAAVGLALVIGLFRHRESLNPEAFTSLKW